jgi:tetratricopeptide (TPR) repeat protein
VQILIQSLLEKGRSSFRRYWRLLLTCLVLVLLFFSRQQINQMDSLFFQPSVSGAKGLMYYLAGRYDRAAIAYRTHFKEEVERGWSTGSPVQDALVRGDLPAAQSLAQQALTEGPRDLGAILMMGEVELERGYPGDALSRFATALEISPDNRDAFLLSALAHSRIGAYGEAIEDFKLALGPRAKGGWDRGFLLALQITGDLGAVPSDKRAACLQAHFFRYLRIFDPSNGRLAVAAAREAIKAGDHVDDAYVTIGVIAAKEGDREQAIVNFLKAIEHNRKNAEAYRWAATVYAHRGGDLLNEYRMWKAMFEVAPEDHLYREAYVEFLFRRLGDYPQAMAIALQGLERAPKDVKWLDWVGRLYESLGRHEEAIAYDRMILEIQPNNSDAYAHIGVNFIELHRLDDAITAFKTALSISPSSLAAHLGLAMSYDVQHRRREAIDEYEAVLRLGVQNVEVQVSLCGLYHYVGEFRQAAQCFKRVLAQDPGNQAALHLYPYTLKSLGQLSP